MAVEDDARKVVKKIVSIYAKRRVQIFALARFWAAESINFFRSQQLKAKTGTYWINQTQTAAERFFASAFADGPDIGFLIAHGIDYGVYLELANNGKNEAIKPILRLFAPKFIEDARKLYLG